MKKTILLLAAVIICLPAEAQRRNAPATEHEEFTAIGTNNLYSSEYKFNDRKQKNIFKRRFGLEDGHWSGLVLSYNGLVSSLSDLNMPEEASDMAQSAKSIGISMNFVDVALPISRNIGIVTGLGMEFNNFRFKKDIGLKMEDGYTVVDYQYIDRGINLKKSKINTAYLNIPLLLEFQFGRGNKIFINGGVIGGWKMGSHTKIKVNDGPFRGKFKERDNISLKNFHYGYTVNLGFDHIGISATYYPTSIFRTGTGPHLEQVNIGITILR